MPHGLHGLRLILVVPAPIFPPDVDLAQRVRRGHGMAKRSLSHGTVPGRMAHDLKRGRAMGK